MTSNTLTTSLKMLLAICLGEAILVLGTTLIQEILLGGISYYTSSGPALFSAGIGSFFVACLAGFVAFGVMKRKTEVPIAVLSMLVIIETFWLINSGHTSGPIWFDLMASISLIIGFWVGRFSWRIRTLGLA